MRLIDADALKYRDVKVTTNEIDIFGFGGYIVEERKGILQEEIWNAPTVDAIPQWIPCWERLPEIGEGFCSKDVIVALDDGGITFTCLEATLFGSVCWQIERMNEIEGGKEINVIAWMPLPEPYTERKDNE